MSKFQHDVMLKIVKIIDLVMITIPFALCWELYYSYQVYAKFGWRGNWTMIGLFAVLFFLLGKVYDAFWMSLQRISELIYGQVLAAMATNYAACSQLAGRAMFEDQGFTVIPNVIQTEKYRFDPTMRKSVRQKMNATDKFVVGTVGRLAEQKNPFFAIDVFKCLLKNVPNAEYWWVGNGPLEERVKTYIEEKKLTKYIKLLGSRNDTVELYQGMDAFFLPSFFEGLPVTGVEAQAMGLPMVVSDTVTCEMVYTDLVDYVCLSDTSETWASRLETALRKKTEREQYAERLKQSAFSDVGCGNRLEQVYSRWVNG